MQPLYIFILQNRLEELDKSNIGTEVYSEMFTVTIVEGATKI